VVEQLLYGSGRQAAEPRDGLVHGRGVCRLCELVRGERAAVALAAFIGGYWLVRLVLDVTWFGHGEWPPGRRFVLAHVGLDLLFGYLTVTYLGLAAWHLVKG
jgi:hypothetical protein